MCSNRGWCAFWTRRRADRARIAGIAPTALQSSYRCRGALVRVRGIVFARCQILDAAGAISARRRQNNVGSSSESPLEPREGLCVLPNEATILRSLRGRPAGAGFRACTRCHPQSYCDRAKRARRDQRADRLQPLERERERGGVSRRQKRAFYNCSDRRRRRRSRPSAPRRCTPRSRRTSTSARRAPRRSRTTSPSSRASSAAPTRMRGLLTRQPTPPWPRPPLRRAGPDAASQKSRPYATPPSLR